MARKTGDASSQRKAAQARSDAERAVRGQRLVLVVVGVLVVVDIASLIVNLILYDRATTTSFVRIGISLAIYFLVARGHAWARYTLVVLAMVGCAVLGAFLMSAEPTATIAPAIVILCVYAAAVVMLTFSRDVVYFEERERNRRSGR